MEEPSQCCNKCSSTGDGSTNCVAKAFVKTDGEVDWEQTCLFVRHMRRNIDVKGKEDVKSAVRVLMEEVTKKGRQDAKQPNDYSFFFGGADIKICMESFCHVMKVSENFVKQVSADLRKGKEPVVKKSGNMYDDDTFFDDISYQDAVYIFEDWAGISAGI